MNRTLPILFLTSLIFGCATPKKPLPVLQVANACQEQRQRAEAAELRAYLAEGALVDAQAQRDDLRHRIEAYLGIKCRCRHKGIFGKP